MIYINKISIDLKALEVDVIRAKGGNSLAKERIIKIFKPTIIKIMNTTFIPNWNKEDIEQELVLSILLAIDKYKGDKTFFWYCIQSMKNNIYYKLKKDIKSKEYTNIDKIPLVDNFDVSSNLDREEDIKELLLAMEELKTNEYDIIYKLFFEGYSYKDVMEEFNLEYSTATSRKRKAIQELKSKLKSY